MDLSLFLDVVQDGRFIDNQDLQNQMMEFAITSMSPELIMILCHLDELHSNTYFATNVLTKELKSQASIEQLITALQTLTNIPVGEYLEEVLAKGTSEQIQQVAQLRRTWACESINEI